MFIRIRITRNHGLTKKLQNFYVIFVLATSLFKTVRIKGRNPVFTCTDRKKYNPQKTFEVEAVEYILSFKETLGIVAFVILPH